MGAEIQGGKRARCASFVKNASSCCVPAEGRGVHPARPGHPGDGAVHPGDVPRRRESLHHLSQPPHPGTAGPGAGTRTLSLAPRPSSSVGRRWASPQKCPRMSTRRPASPWSLCSRPRALSTFFPDKALRGLLCGPYYLGSCVVNTFPSQPWFPRHLFSPVYFVGLQSRAAGPVLDVCFLFIFLRSSSTPG